MSEECQDFEICGLLAEPGENLCILHLKSDAKNLLNFDEALKRHRGSRGDRFIRFFFPSKIDFSTKKFQNADFTDSLFSLSVSFAACKFEGTSKFCATQCLSSFDIQGALFSGDADFSNIVFLGDSDFFQVRFKRSALFDNARFDEEIREKYQDEPDPGAQFKEAAFEKKAIFSSAFFGIGADFSSAAFLGDVNFSKTKFQSLVTFSRTKFEGLAEFKGVDCGQNVSLNFSGSSFKGRTIFAAKGENERLPNEEESLAFENVEIDLTDVDFSDKSKVSFRHADLSKTKLLHTEVKGIEFVGVRWAQVHDYTWPRGRARNGVFDEILHNQQRSDGKTYSAPVEALYRGLKKNYEERQYHSMSGDFHYGEKEMRRHSPQLRQSHKRLLWIYRVLGGYGESLKRPVIAASLLLLVSSVLCYFGAAESQAKNVNAAKLSILQESVQSVIYSFRVMFLLRPDELRPAGILGQAVQTIQMTLGVLFLSLIALAVRQRLRR